MMLNTEQPLPTSFAEASKRLPKCESNPKKECSALVKSPLRYPGGKSRAVNCILQMLPPGIDRLVSPFFGGGSIELAAASRLGAKVYGYDIFAPLVAFWQSLISNPPELAKRVLEHYPLSRTKFYALQNRFPAMENVDEAAAAFFVLNRASFSGTTLSGGMSPNHPRFTQTAIDRLAVFSIEGLSVKEADFTQSIPRHQNDFLYLDPPYANGEKLYGKDGDCHKDFDHETLAKLLRKQDGWLLSYNDCERVRDLYQGFSMMKPEWTYGMSSDKSPKELLILNPDYRRIK